MPKGLYALENDGSKSLLIEWNWPYRNIRVSLDGRLLLTAASRKALNNSQAVTLPDGSRLEVRMRANNISGWDFLLTRNGEALPGSMNDPERVHKAATSTVLFIAVISGIAGTLSLFLPGLRHYGIDPYTLVFALAFGVMWWFVRQRSLAALGVAFGLFALDALLAVLEMGKGDVRPNGGIVVKALLLYMMWRGLGATRQLRARKAAKAAAPVQVDVPMAPAAPLVAVPMMACPKCGHRQTGTLSCAGCGTEFEKFFRAHQTMRELQIKLGRGAPPPALMICPKCQHQQLETQTCGRCGVIFEKFFQAQQRLAQQRASAPQTVSSSAPSLARALSTLVPAPGAGAGEGALKPSRTMLGIAAAAAVLTGFFAALPELAYRGESLRVAFATVLVAAIVGAAIPVIVVALTQLLPNFRNWRQRTLAFNWAQGFVLASCVVAATMRLGGSDRAEVQRATAFIMVDNSRDQFSGSGFLVHAEDGQGLVVTNAHVAVAAGRNANISVVFNSGTTEELTLKGSIAALDQANDLALIRVAADKISAQPVAVNANPAPPETTEVMVLGFPLGDALATSKDTPAITVTKGIVSSIRKDVNDDAGLIQVDADINSGNSGGPVITVVGDLVGVASSKVSDTGIGFARPAYLVRNLLDGTASNFSVETSSGGLTVSADMLDAFGRIESAELLLAPLAGPKVTSNHDRGIWDSIAPVAQRLSFVSGSGAPDRLHAVVPAGSYRGGTLIAQVALKLKDGDLRYTPAFRIDVSADGEIVAGGPGVFSGKSREIARAGREAAPAAPPSRADTPEPPTPPPPPPKTLEQELAETDARMFRAPGALEDIVVAGGGGYLVAKISTPPQLAVFDVAGQTWNSLAMPSPDFWVAANKNSAFVLLPGTMTLRTHSLPDLAQQNISGLPQLGGFKGMAVGSNSEDTPLILVGDGDVVFVDPRNLKRLSVQLDTGPGKRSLASEFQRREIRVRAAAQGRAFTFWRTGVSPEGIYLLQLFGNNGKLRYERETGGYLAPAPDGSIIYSNLQGRLDATLKPRSSDSSSPRHLIPDIGGAYYVEAVHSGHGGKAGIQVQAFMTSDDSAAADTFRAIEMRPDSTHPYGHHRMTLAEDKRYILLPHLGKLITVPYSDDMVVVRPFAPRRI